MVRKMGENGQGHRDLRVLPYGNDYVYCRASGMKPCCILPLPRHLLTCNRIHAYYMGLHQIVQAQLENKQERDAIIFPMS